MDVKFCYTCGKLRKPGDNMCSDIFCCSGLYTAGHNYRSYQRFGTYVKMPEELGVKLCAYCDRERSNSTPGEDCHEAYAKYLLECEERQVSL